MKKADWETENEQNKLRGKGKVPLFTMEIQFEDWDNRQITRRWHSHNLAWKETLVNRESMITHGVFLEKGPGRGEIVFPWQIVRCLVDVQRHGWKEMADGPGENVTNK